MKTFNNVETPDTLALEVASNKHGINNLSILNLREELPNQKLTNQPFLFKGKFDLDENSFKLLCFLGRLMHLKNI